MVPGLSRWGLLEGEEGDYSHSIVAGGSLFFAEQLAEVDSGIVGNWDS